jgi:predicted nuclease with TOPRIM domain
MVREWIAGTVKKVTLELIYEVVDERTREIKESIDDIKARQEEDFRFLNQKIDSQIGQVRQEIGQVRQEVAQLNQKIDSQIGQVRQEIAQLNQRIDTVIQLLIDISKQKP